MPNCLNLTSTFATSVSKMMKKLLQITSQLGRNPVDEVLAPYSLCFSIFIDNAAIYPSIRRRLESDRFIEHVLQAPDNSMVLWISEA